MTTILVSILSDQPIPNVLFIQQMGTAGAEHIFLSTERMEAVGMPVHIAGASALANDEYTVIKLDANDPALILDALDNYEWPINADYIVNITGGTKMMSQMAYLHFSEKQNATVYY